MCSKQSCLGDSFVAGARKVFARGTDDFRRLFSGLSKYASRDMSPSTLFDEVTKVFKAHLEAEFELVLQEYKLLEKFARLCRLEEEQKEYEGTHAWRPSGNPANDVEAHLRGSYEEHARKLKALLEERKAENSKLEEQVALGRKQCDAINAEAELLAMEEEKEQRRLCPGERLA